MSESQGVLMTEQESMIDSRLGSDDGCSDSDSFIKGSIASA